MESHDDAHWMKEALREAEVAARHGDVPVGAVVAQDGILLGRGRNRREADGDPTAHAEVVALRKAAQTVGSWRLDAATLYVTLEPCPMCLGALLLARTPRLVFGCDDPKAGACGSVLDFANHPGLNHRLDVSRGVCAVESSILLKSFFQQLRGSAQN